MLDLFVVLPAIRKSGACVPVLVFTEFGDLEGEAIFHFSGTSGSRNVSNSWVIYPVDYNK